MVMYHYRVRVVMSCETVGKPWAALSVLARALRCRWSSDRRSCRDELGLRRYVK